MPWRISKVFSKLLLLLSIIIYLYVSIPVRSANAVYKDKPNKRNGDPELFPSMAKKMKL
jgi:hypothetical protein